MGIGFAKGDYLTLKGWSNATATLKAIVNIRPKDWGPPPLDRGDPYPLVLEVDLASDRSQGTVHFKLEINGEIDDAVINYTSGSALVRGQTYTQLLLQRGGTTLSATSLLAAGYVYGGNTNGGHLPSLHHIVEAGPAGGHGHMRNVAAVDPAAGSEIAAVSVPVGAIWVIRSFTVQLVQGITQTPLPAILIRNGSAVTVAQIPITGTAIGSSSTAQLTWAIGANQTNFTAVLGDEMHLSALPLLYLTGVTGSQDDIGTVTDGIGANTNYGLAQLRVEEWVMPN